MKFNKIAGQAHAKRATEVALTGSHSITFIGSHESQATEFKELSWSISEAHAYAVAPCPCGHYGSDGKECTCSRDEVKQWRFDHQHRTDITVRLHQLRPDTIVGWARHGYQHGEPHASIMARIEGARVIVDEEREVEPEVWDLMRAAIAELHLTPSQVRATMDVANTIAALSATDTIQVCHVAEAIQYR